MQLSPQKAGLSHTASPYATHPNLLISADNTVAFPKQNLETQSAHRPSNKLALLIGLEAAIRQQPTLTALFMHAVNETHALLQFDQAVLLRFNRRKIAEIEAVNGIAKHDVNGAMSGSLVALVNSLKSPENARSIAPITKNFPFKHIYWAPLLDQKKQVFGGLLLARQTNWEEADGLIIQRIAGCYAHAARALTPPSLLRKFAIPKWFVLGLPLALLALGFIPVPLTTLAPFEVIADKPDVATAPIDGVIAEIIADPNQLVKKGDPLFRFDATSLKASADIARQKATVAEARLMTAQQGAFTDKEMKRSLQVTEKEWQLAIVESQFADQLLAQVNVVAKRDGMASYAARSDWVGKPVRIGQKIMEVADPDLVAYRVDLGVHDSIGLQKQSSVSLFFDADPLNPHDGEIQELSFHATEQAGGVFAYRVLVKPRAGAPAMRIGLRGTAQLRGENVSLGFYLFRRPIAALRQYLGR